MVERGTFACIARDTASLLETVCRCWLVHDKQCYLMLLLLHLLRIVTDTKSKMKRAFICRISIVFNKHS